MGLPYRKIPPRPWIEKKGRPNIFKDFKKQLNELRQSKLEDSLEIRNLFENSGNQTEEHKFWAEEMN